MAQQAKTELLVQIHDLIDGHFDLQEFQDLCFRLGIKYDNLRGENLSTRIQNLVLRLDREHRLDDLLNFCARLRPSVNWPDLTVPIAFDDAAPPLSTQPRKSRQIFLSHARQDAGFAHQLADDLRRHGWETWIAPDDIHPGEKWIDAINRGLSESGMFILVITPDAVNSRWVKSEINFAISLQHEGAVRFIPLLVKATTMPPLWQVYEWIPFNVDYKAGLERLLQEIQPEQASEILRLYRKLQEAIRLGKWVTAQEIGAQINKLYPDYRETEELLALAQREEVRDQLQLEEAAKIYGHLQATMASADWITAANLVKQIEALVPNYQDVKKLKEQASKGQQQKLRDKRNQLLYRIPVWSWISGITVVGILILLLILQSISGGNSTVIKTATLQAVSQVPLETLTPTLKPGLTTTITPIATWTKELHVVLTKTLDSVHVSNSANALPTVNPAITPEPPLSSTKIVSTPIGGGNGTILFTSGGSIYTVRIDGTDKTQIAPEFTMVYHPARWSPDGSQIVLVGSLLETRGIYVINSDGSSPVLLKSSTSVSHPTWSPDGTKIAFEERYLLDGEFGYGIFTIDSDGTDEILLRDTGGGEYLDWSPEGEKIIFAYGRSFFGNDIFEITVDNPDPLPKRLTYSVTSGTSISGSDTPRYSPDGSQIVYTNYNSNENLKRSIYVMSSNGTRIGRLTNSDFEDYFPVWSPDGSKIIFVSHRQSNWSIYMVDSDGKNETLLFDNGFVEIGGLDLQP